VGRSVGFNRECDVGVRPGRPVCAGSDRARRVGHQWAGLLGERKRELGRRETQSAGPVLVCEIAGREMVLARNGFRVPVCEIAGREMVLARNGFRVLVCEIAGREMVLARNGFRVPVCERAGREMVSGRKWWSGAGL